MHDKSRAKLILERWLVSIKREDRRHDKMPGIFSALATDLFAAGIEFDIAHETIKIAAKAMYPSPDTIKYVYSRSKMKKTQTFIEFTRTWQESLDKTALESFYSFYDIEGLDPSKISPTKKISAVNPQNSRGLATEDELNEEDFWKSTKIVTRDKPWLFDDDEEKAQ